MSDPRPGAERSYQVDDEWSRAVFARRTGEVASFLAPHLRAGMRLIDCGSGPGSITADLAHAVAPGGAIGIDLREDALVHGRTLGRQRGITNLTFRVASVYQLPYADGSFDAAFVCAVLQHLAAPVAALEEMRRVLTPGEVGHAPGPRARVQHGPSIGCAPAACPPPRGRLRADTSVGQHGHRSGATCRLARGDVQSRAESLDSAPRDARRVGGDAGLGDEARAGADGRSRDCLG